jgi:hypothetical protein
VLTSAIVRCKPVFQNPRRSLKGGVSQRNESVNVVNIDHRSEKIGVARWFRHRHHPVTETRHRWLPCRLLLVNCLEHPLYTTDDLWAIRRGVLLYARSFLTGPERNQHRQIALSVRGLFKNEKWLNQHAIGVPDDPYFSPPNGLRAASP